MKPGFAIQHTFGGWRTGMLLVASLILVGATSCISGVQLRTGQALSGGLPEGPYTMLLYGCGYSDRLDNAVILAPEGKLPHLEIYAPAFEVKVRQGVSAADSVRDADKFLKCNRFYHSSRVSGIVDPSGRIVGYEVRPLYLPVYFGRDDILTITYRMNGDQVKAYIWLDQDIESMMNNYGDRMEGAGGGGGGSMP